MSAGLLAVIKLSMATAGFLALLSLPLLLLRFVERRSGDPLWLYHKVFRDERT
jgi:hypothetical protein